LSHRQYNDIPTTQGYAASNGAGSDSEYRPLGVMPPAPPTRNQNNNFF
jgi:hypothetical protein